MSLYRMMHIQKFLCVTLLGSLIHCSEESEQLGSVHNTTSSTSTTSNTGGSTSSVGSGGSDGGGGTGGESTGGSDTGGTGVGGTIAVCGNDTAETGESCDGTDLNEADCSSFGFDEGVLACTTECEFDTSGCSGTELCEDKKDNDGDGLIDCQDAVDCTTCPDSCEATPIEEDVTTDGDTTGLSATLDPSCVTTSGASEMVYVFTSSITGMVNAHLTSDAGFALSMRSVCADETTELACADKSSGASAEEFVTAPIEEGQSVYVVVDGTESNEYGSFTLHVLSRYIQCGDFIRDPGEECDDGDLDSGDGCSETCSLEASEVEPNDSIETANTYSAPWFATISDLGDSDYVAIQTTADSSTITATTYDLGDGACAGETLDSYLEIYNDTDATPIEENDNNGEGLCAHVVAYPVPAGIYYVRVRASNDMEEFPYQLVVDVDACGNGTVSEGEQCDDGNTVAGDGCDANCLEE